MKKPYDLIWEDNVTLSIFKVVLEKRKQRDWILIKYARNALYTLIEGQTVCSMHESFRAQVYFSAKTKLMTLITTSYRISYNESLMVLQNICNFQNAIILFLQIQMTF